MNDPIDIHIAFWSTVDKNTLIRRFNVTELMSIHVGESHEWTQTDIDQYAHNRALASGSAPYSLQWSDTKSSCCWNLSLHLLLHASNHRLSLIFAILVTGAMSTMEILLPYELCAAPCWSEMSVIYRVTHYQQVEMFTVRSLPWLTYFHNGEPGVSRLV